MSEQSIQQDAPLGSDPEADPDAYLAEHGVDYLARDVTIMVGRRRLTREGVLAISEGTVVMFKDGEGSAVDRAVAVAPATEATLVSKPRIEFGASFILTLGDMTFKVLPEATYVGKSFGVLSQIKRARASVSAFEVALEEAKRA